METLVFLRIVGPIDLTREIPYETQNSLQNPSVQPGANIYMKGVTQHRYSAECAKKVNNQMPTYTSLDIVLTFLLQVYERMCELSSKDLRISVLFELFPLEKINSVSNNATAFNIRGPNSNVLCITMWDVDSLENSELGKKAAYAMTDIVSDEEKLPEASKTRAYGNYGMYLSLFRCFEPEISN